MEPVQGSKDLCHVHLEVRSTDLSRPLRGLVTFYLHPTFGTSVVPILPDSGIASLDRLSRGAFTVGAVADNEATRLELDLSQLPGIPTWFRDG